ncbi:MAG: DUF1611 domain-containing protein [Nostocaceae cyanobacterium]|nr:DUF1611 domain-containing protein [Nostocaceae cyanobacterium]
MSAKYFFTCLTRISDLESRPFQVVPVERSQWATGDYVVGKVTTPLGKLSKVELSSGRMVEVLEGDLVVGAFGVRRATLEIVGDWQHIGSDNHMQALTEGGIFGRETSRSFLVPAPTSMIYVGHVVRDGKKVSMQDFVPNVVETAYNCPTVMMIGTSMSSGKTTAARIIIHLLKEAGFKVVGTKLTGAGQYHDILTMKDAGADRVFDFVDAGLPSTVCSPSEFRVSLRKLLAMITTEQPDVVVAEAGASPFEPYNGSVVLEEIKEQIRCTVLCASDPYAVVGVSQSFGLTPDLISGIAASTTAGVDLVEKLTGVKALTLPNSKSLPDLKQLLQQKLGF